MSSLGSAIQFFSFGDLIESWLTLAGRLLEMISPLSECVCDSLVSLWLCKLPAFKLRLTSLTYLSDFPPFLANVQHSMPVQFTLVQCKPFRAPISLFLEKVVMRWFFLQYSLCVFLISTRFSDDFLLVVPQHQSCQWQSDGTSFNQPH